MAEEKKVKVALKANYKVEPFSRAKVDIIIPFHGEYSKVSKLIESIIWKVRSNPYRICLVDDGSPNFNFIESMKKVPQVITVRNDERMGFGAALKTGFDHTNLPWVLFMHSDCIVEDGNWMYKLGQAMLKLGDQGVRLVSSRSDNPGDAVDARLKAAKGDAAEDVIVGNDDFVPLYSAMCHRSLFDEINGFIRPYPYVGYEDEELAYRMRKWGFKQAICGSSWVHHEGGGTINNMCKANPDIRKELDKNRNLCIEHIRQLLPKAEKKSR